MIDVNSDGTKGYNSVFYVKTDSPYQTVVDLKGKNLGLVDPNLTSGYDMPLFALNKLGIPDAEKYFGKVIVTSIQENAVLALAQGTVDVAANWWNADEDSNLTPMLDKHMVRGIDGKELGKNDFRVILKSDLIINALHAMLSDLPPDLKTAIGAAWMAAPAKDRAAFDRLSHGKNRPWAPVDNAAYDETIALIRFVDRLHKQAT